MITKHSGLLSLIIVFILVLAACSSSPTIEEPAVVVQDAEPVQEIIVEPQENVAEPVAAAPISPTPLPKEVETNDVVVETAVLPPATSTTLTETEIEALQYMREEEKLARDVYLLLYEQWGLPIFQNIASGEQAHIDTVLSLMQRYDLADSAANLGPGEFANTDLQALYDQLSASGSQSLANSLSVGALIEETDIADLESRLANLQNGEITQAFNNLRQGSFNHLRAYANMLERQTGAVYQPQVLSAAAYADALAGTGGGFGGRGSGNGNGNGQGNRGGNS